VTDRIEIIADRFEGLPKDKREELLRRLADALTAHQFDVARQVCEETADECYKNIGGKP
jgi:acyl-CoA reductase-like NAD-dependent aldehyde dehydrogenase